MNDTGETRRNSPQERKGIQIFLSALIGKNVGDRVVNYSITPQDFRLLQQRIEHFQYNIDSRLWIKNYATKGQPSMTDQLIASARSRKYSNKIFLFIKQ